MHGPDLIVLVDKPAGSTSFRTLDVIKRTLGTRRVGHAGTLDSFASGLLVVASGTCTRLLPLFLALDKTYLARFEFGRETDTLDPQGNEVGRGPVPEIETISTALAGFRGSIQQLPPDYSAVHVDGRRAHELARRGPWPGISEGPAAAVLMFANYHAAPSELSDWKMPRFLKERRKMRAAVRCAGSSSAFRGWLR
jgi:tRNA pseudouridine55 synthase